MRSCRHRSWSRLLILASLLSACAAGPPEPVVLPGLRAAPRTTPLILVPGVTGTVLRDRSTGRLAWGNGCRLITPHDGGYGIALPLDPESTARDRLVSTGPVLEVRLLFWHKPVYGDLLRLMQANGYRPGDLESPRPDETFFFFNYDWRRSSIKAAKKLARELERLRRVRGEELLGVDLVCQSNAARICRYFAKYGALALDEAEAGAARRPASVRIEKLLLVGTSNGGSLRVLREMNRGRRYVAVIGRRWRPETLFTLPSLYEELPVYRDNLFFDADGGPLQVNLFDPASWRLYGWSIYADEVQRRLSRQRRRDLFSTPDVRARFLRRSLDRAQRLHGVLARNAPTFAAGRYYLLQGSHLETPDRALLVKENGAWRTYFSGDRRIERDPSLRSLATAAGDGHATVESQNWISPQEEAALAHPPVYLPGRHFEVILEPATHRKMLEFLVD